MKNRSDIITYLGIALFWAAFLAGLIYFEGPKVDCMRLEANRMIDILPASCSGYLN